MGSKRLGTPVLAIVPQRTNVNNLLQQLNEVHPRIKFTVEEERDDCLPFLDVVLRKADGKLRFSVYRRPTNKDRTAIAALPSTGDLADPDMY